MLENGPKLPAKDIAAMVQNTRADFHISMERLRARCPHEYETVLIGGGLEDYRITACKHCGAQPQEPTP